MALHTLVDLRRAELRLLLEQQHSSGNTLLELGPQVAGQTAEVQALEWGCTPRLVEVLESRQIGACPCHGHENLRLPILRLVPKRL